MAGRDSLASQYRPRRGRLVKTGKRSNIRKDVSARNAENSSKELPLQSDYSRKFMQAKKLQALQERCKVVDLRVGVASLARMAVGSKDILKSCCTIVM